MLVCPACKMSTDLLLVVSISDTMREWSQTNGVPEARHYVDPGDISYHAPTGRLGIHAGQGGILKYSGSSLHRPAWFPAVIFLLIL